MFGWLFKKKIVDDTDNIYDLEHGKIYPLHCDPEMYTQGYDKLSDILLKWINQDIALNNPVDSDVEHSLTYQFKDIDLKFLPFAGNTRALNNILDDTEYSKAGTRFFDAIVNIEIQVPIEVTECFKGRFLKAMLYDLPRTIDNHLLPTKDEWINCLSIHPWVPYLQVVQELYDSNELIAQITKLKGGTPTVVGINAPLGGTRASSVLPHS